MADRQTLILFGATGDLARHKLWPALHALMSWGKRYRERRTKPRAFLHAKCGTPLDDVSACPKCGVTPAADDVITVGAPKEP